MHDPERPLFGVCVFRNKGNQDLSPEIFFLPKDSFPHVRYKLGPQTPMSTFHLAIQTVSVLVPKKVIFSLAVKQSGSPTPPHLLRETGVFHFF